MNNILDRFSLAGKNPLIVCPENPYGREIAAGLAATRHDLTKTVFHATIS